MQREYGFLYLGELLERYEERFGMTPPDRRAIALALGYREAAKKGFAQTYLHLYISASKAGGQYLDSLGGKAEVSSEAVIRKTLSC